MKIALLGALGISLITATPLAASSNNYSSKEITYTSYGNKGELTDGLMGNTFKFESEYNSILSAKLIIKNNTDLDLNYSISYGEENLYSETFDDDYLSQEFDITSYFISLYKVPGTSFVTTFTTVTSDLNFDAEANLILTYSTRQIVTNAVDVELYKIGVNTQEYYASMESQIVALTDKYDTNRSQDLLVFYVFNPNPLKEYSLANISYYYSDELEEDGKMTFTSLRTEVEFLQSNGNGYFQKYIVTDLSIQPTKYKAYKITKLTCDDGKYDAYDSIFKFEEQADGSISYSREKIDLVYLENEKALNYYIAENWDALNAETGKNNVFYGFDIRNYDIKQLLEIEVAYNLCDYEAIAYAGASSFAIAPSFDIHKGVFDEEWVKEKIEKNELDLTKEELEFLSVYYPSFKTVDNNLNKTITPGSETVYGDFRLFFGREEYKWDNIIKMSSLDEYNISNPYFKAQLVSDFGQNDFVIYIDSFDATCSFESSLDERCDLYRSTSQSNDEIFTYFENRGKPCPKTMWLKEIYGAYNSYFPIIAHEKNMSIYYQTQTIKQLEIVRMKFLDHQDNEYDLSAISTPVDAEEFIDVSVADDALDWLKNYFDSFATFFEKYAWVGIVIIVLISLTIVEKLFVSKRN